MTKRKAIGIGVKGVISKVKDRGLNQYVLLYTDRRVVPTGEISC